MRATTTWSAPVSTPFTLVLGTNEIASAIAAKLAEAEFAVVMSHDIFPPVIRRGMAFHDTLFGESNAIEGIIGERADTIMDIARIHTDRCKVAVTEMHLTDIIASRLPLVIIDARMQKHRVTPDLRAIARMTIGIGPNFEVGMNCDVAIETHPAHVGATVSCGATMPADGKASDLGGAGCERFVYSDFDGVWHTPLDIGTRVYKDLQLGSLGRKPILAPIDGVLRGIVRDGSRVPANVKLLEIDPRGRQACWNGIDARGRAIGSSVVATVRQFIEPRRITPHTAIHI